MRLNCALNVVLTEPKILTAMSLLKNHEPVTQTLMKEEKYGFWGELCL